MSDHIVAFWMVYVEGNSAPAYKHETEASARTEAERLATSTRKRVYVLQAIANCEFSNVHWQDTMATFNPAEEMPF